jgi:hypothetical protein
MPGAPGPATRRPSPGADGGKLAASLSTTLYRWRCTDGKARRLPQKPTAARGIGECRKPTRRVIFPAAGPLVITVRQKEIHKCALA